MYRKIVDSPIGKIELIEEDNNITEINILKNIKINSIKQKNTKLLMKTEKQLKEYFSGIRTKFTVPLNPKGTKFMKEVWNELLNIPYGEVRTYKEIAQKIGNINAARAVGMANHKNPIPIIIPCHRVIGSNNKLVGYALGLYVKQYLLNLERKELS